MDVERKWQITVMPDTHNVIRLFVPENCYTSELFEAIKKHPQCPICTRFQLYYTNASDEPLICSTEKRLSHYDIVHQSVLSLVVSLPGGVWPTEQDLEGETRNLSPSGELKTTSSPEHPDILGLDDSSLRAVMPCGHAIAPLSLALHCYYELEKGEHEILCPNTICRKKWNFSWIRNAACLTSNEFQEFQSRALFNRFKSISSVIKPCPKCNTFSSPIHTGDKRLVCEPCTSRQKRRYEFCWICLQEWKSDGLARCGNLNCADYKPLLEILEKCPDKEIIRGVKSPSKRACPKCTIIIEHAEKCKHIKCTKCKHDFCFVCLKPHPCTPDKNVFEACNVAPRQTSAAVIKN